MWQTRSHDQFTSSEGCEWSLNKVAGDWLCFFRSYEREKLIWCASRNSNRNWTVSKISKISLYFGEKNAVETQLQSVETAERKQTRRRWKSNRKSCAAFCQSCPTLLLWFVSRLRSRSSSLSNFVSDTVAGFRYSFLKQYFFWKIWCSISGTGVWLEGCLTGGRAPDQTSLSGRPQSTVWPRC